MKSKPTIAVDVDATILRYDGWQGIEHFGDALPGAREFLEELRKDARVLIWSTRGTESVKGKKQGEARHLRDLLKRALDERGLPYDDVWIGQGKPMAIAFIDDRAVTCRPQEEPAAYSIALRMVKLLMEKRRSA
jgi:hypothetical protein